MAMEWLLKALEEKLIPWVTDELIPWITKKLLPWLEERLFLRFEQGILEKVGVAALLGVIFAAAPIGAILAIHLALRGRRARVFISFQHERESLAEILAGRFVSAGIQPVKLPFLDNPDHDRLLDEVKQAIRHCDVFICVPGRNPSFVESEVSMAFGLEKPLLFVVSEQDTPRLPNTAKKGYPILGLERLEGNFTTFVNFCSYLAGDWRSVVQLYGTIWLIWGPGLILLANILGVLVMVGIMQSTQLPMSYSAWHDILRDPATLWFLVGSVVLFLGPYAYFIRRRFELRSRVRRAICNERFGANSLPKVLDASLTRENILEILYPGSIVAEHETSPHAAGTS